MIRPQFRLSLDEELIVDNFAGGGGASTGIELALGRHVDHARNHDEFALGMHRINHPQTVHHREDIFSSTPDEICEGRRVGLAHFSPDCKHFSKAKGGMPLNKRIRGLVYEMIRWAKYGARVMTMENVEEIVTHGPLIRIKKGGKWGYYPDPKNKGRTWQAVLSILSTGVDSEHPDLPEILDVLGGYVTKEECVRGFGFNCEARVVRACDLGTPTIRKRLFMVARRDGKPIVWPQSTHGPRESIRARGEKKLKPYRTIAECIDWNIPCPSIFLDRAAAKKARCKRPLVKATLRRVAKGVDRFILKAKQPFIVSVTRTGEEGRISPVVSRYNGDHSGRTDGAARNIGLDDPLTTQDTSNRFGLVEGRLAPIVTEHANASNERSFSADEPLRTQCAEIKGGHFALVAGTLVQTGYGEREGQEPRVIDPNGPGMTAVAGGCKQGLVAANIVKLRGNAETHAPGTTADEPGHTISAGGNHHGLVAASVVRHFGESVGQGVEEPAPTVMANGGGKSGVIAAYLAQHNGGEVGHQTVGHDARDPFSTISAKGSQQQLVAASIAAYYKTATDGQSIDDPSRTVTTKDRLGLVESILACGLTEEQLAGALRVAAFLREYGVKLTGAFAMVGNYIIVDLGMRMLTPRELFRAQGFGDHYVIDRAWLVDPATGGVKEVHLTKEQQIRMCGNSVCPQVMEAIVSANVPELAAWEKGERKRREVLA